MVRISRALVIGQTEAPTAAELEIAGYPEIVLLEAGGDSGKEDTAGTQSHRPDVSQTVALDFGQDANGNDNPDPKAKPKTKAA